MSDARITVLVGAFGSGKTELALHLARRLAREGHSTSLADLDVVTPYFRSRDLRGVLAGEGVRLVAPGPEFDTADLPILVGNLREALLDPGARLVVDVGGDEGARVLGALSGSFDPGQASILLVANPRRPFQGNATAIAQTRDWLSRLARLPVSGLIANAHLQGMTTPEVIREGYLVVSAAARKTGLPLEAVAVPEFLSDVVSPADYPVPVWFIKLHFAVPWEPRG